MENSPPPRRAGPTLGPMLADVRVDASGTWCPIPILRLAKAVRPLGPGVLVELVATDPGVQKDPPAWCEATGHRLLGLERQEASWVAWVRTAGG